jgi:hypothetical protein
MNGTHQNICIHCGFCCNGTLFNHAGIKENEPIATGFAFEIIPGEKRSFKQPCPYYEKMVCAIYNERPYSVCESFQCKLLRSVKADKTTIADALKVIEDVIRLKAKIEQQLLEDHPENTGDSLSRKMAGFTTHFTSAMGEVEFRKKFGKLLLDFFILNKILSTSFKKNTQKKDVPDV